MQHKILNLPPESGLNFRSAVKELFLMSYRAAAFTMCSYNIMKMFQHKKVTLHRREGAQSQNV